MSDYRGRFVWHELLTTDPKAAGAFFSKIIGWKTKAWDGDHPYTLFLSGAQERAGLMALPEDAKRMGAPPCWLAYVGTGDVDQTARLAASLGGTIVKGPEDIPNAGRYAVLQDPQGATFGIYKSSQPAAADTEPAVGEFSWHELATTDQKAAFTFYQKLFGWEETSSMDMGEMGTYQMFGQSKQGPPLGGLFNKPGEMPGPPAWLPYIRVPDARKTAESVKKLGAQIINGPMEVPGGDWIAQGVDQQGAMFAVHSPSPAAPAAAAASAPAKSRANAPARKKPAAKKTAAPRRKAAARKAARKPAGKTKPVKKPLRRAPKKAARKGKKKGRR